MVASPPIPPSGLASLAELVEARSGLHFTMTRFPELASKVERAIAESGFPTWEAYLAQIASAENGVLFERLIEVLTVGETYFFRHRPYFELLERDVLPDLVAQRREARQLRLWCAGCATGEEAYSLAILVHRLLPILSNWQVSILATDLNRAFLRHAEEGVYSNWSFRETDDAFKAAYFTREGTSYRVRPEVRRLVRFAHLNLVEDIYPSSSHGIAQLDLVLCRNVLLYFAPETSRQVVLRLRASLAPNGWLMLGPSDSLPGLLEGFTMHATQGAVVYRLQPDHQPTTSSEPSPARSGLGGGSRRLAHDQPAGTVGLAASTARDRRRPSSPISSRSAAPQVAASAGRTTVPSPGVGDWRESWQAAHTSAEGGRFQEAEAHCRDAIVRAKLRPEPYYLLGTLHESRGDDAAARAALRQALYVDRTFVPAHLALAAIYRRRGHLEQARLTLVRAQQLLHGRAAHELVLAEEGLTVGRLRDALTQALGVDSQAGSR